MGVIKPIKEGECTIILSITGYDNTVINKEISVIVTSEKDASINTTHFNNENLFDIYTFQGVCLKRSATIRNVEDLTSGFYIIGGKKVLIK